MSSGESSSSAVPADTRSKLPTTYNNDYT